MSEWSYIFGQRYLKAYGTAKSSEGDMVTPDLR